jgi:phosphoglycolate phosphatase
MPRLRIGTLDVSPALVIFDKDGTLIDFDYMWASWITELAQRVERAAQIPLTSQLYTAMGYDAARARVTAGSPLAAHSMADLRVLTADVMHAGGLARDDADRAVDYAWFVPDPVALARPLADLPLVFSTLHARGLLTAVATSDDRRVTLATLHALGIGDMVNALVSADDGLPNKPAPDMLLRVCEELNVKPADAMMVGDSLADMEAARRAGIGTRVAVLSGVSSREQLEPHADALIDSVENLIETI